MESRHWVLSIMRYLLAFLVITQLSACIELGRHWDDQVVNLQIDFYRTQCDENDSSLCFRFRESTDDSWDILEDDFSGFSAYQWGFRYWVKANVSFDEFGRPEDYEFLSVLSADDLSGIDNAFSLSLYSDTGVLVANDDTNWQLGGEIDFDCDSYCTDLSGYVSQGYVLSLEFLVSDSTLVLNNLVCAASESDYSSDCEGETNVSWQIAPFMSECGLTTATMCLLYRVTSSDSYELLKLEDGITDFTYTWGERSWTDVIKTVSNGGNITSVVLEELDDDPDDRTGSSYDFLFIVRGDALTKSSSGIIALYGENPDMNCDMYSQCTELNNRIGDDELLLLEAYVDDGEIVITDVICHDDSLDDFRECTDDEDLNWEI